MLRSSNHSSFPKVDENPLDQQLRAVLRAQAAGRATQADVDAAADEVITVVVAQQARAFIDLVSDGMVRWDGPTSYLARHLDGLDTAGYVRLFHLNFHEPRLVVTGDIGRPAPFLVHDYEVAKDVALGRPVKFTLPGPVLVSRLALDEHYGDRQALAHAVADALAAEVADLAAAGCQCFQLDEPLLCRHPEDLDLVAATARKVFAAAGDGAETILSTYFGDLTASVDRLSDLPGTHLGLELTSGSPNATILDRLPAGRGVVLGLFDARTSRQEDAADVAKALLPYRDLLVERDVVVGPNAGLELLPRHQAFDKLLHARYLVEQLTAEWPWPS